MNVKLEFMYRDGANYKSHGSFVLPNKKGYTEQEIAEVLEPLMEEESFIPYYHGLPSIAPIQNEFLPVFHDDVDHSFVELAGWEMTEDKPNWGVDDIDRAIGIHHNDLYDGLRNKKLKEAIQVLHAELNKLHSLKTQEDGVQKRSTG